MARLGNGYFLLHREMIYDLLKEGSQELSLYVLLTMMANTKDTILVRGLYEKMCPKGSVVTSWAELCKALRCSKSTIGKSMQRLIEMGYIQVKPSKQGSTIRIVNYAQLQSGKAVKLSEVFGTDWNHCEYGMSY